jgi:hypothetical protein
MKWPVLAVCVGLMGCVHHAAVMHPKIIGTLVEPPHVVIVPVPTKADRLAASEARHCHFVPGPKLPDVTTAPGLAEAVVRLTERDKLWADYSHRLEAALKACGAKP